MNGLQSFRAAPAVTCLFSLTTGLVQASSADVCQHLSASFHIKRLQIKARPGEVVPVDFLLRNNDPVACGPSEFQWNFGTNINTRLGWWIDPSVGVTLHAGEAMPVRFELLIPNDASPADHQVTLKAVRRPGVHDELALKIKIRRKLSLFGRSPKRSFSDRALTDLSPVRRQERLGHLEKRGLNVSIDEMPVLAAALSDPDPSVRLRSAAAIRLIGKKWGDVVYSEDLVKDFQRALWFGQIEVRGLAISALGVIGGTAIHALHEITAFVGEGPEIRRVTYGALGRLGEDDPSILPLLVAGAKDVDPDSRHSAIWALGRHRHLDATGMNALIEGLRDTIPFIRAESANALGSPVALSCEGQFKARVTQALNEAARDTDAGVRSFAGDSLRWLEGTCGSRVPATH